METGAGPLPCPPRVGAALREQRAATQRSFSAGLVNSAGRPKAHGAGIRVLSLGALHDVA